MPIVEVVALENICVADQHGDLVGKGDGSDGDGGVGEEVNIICRRSGVVCSGCPLTPVIYFLLP